MYVPIGTHTFENRSESARANCSTIALIPREDCKRSAANAVDDNRVKHRLKYLFANTRAKDKDEIYPVTVSEIAATQQKHRIYKKPLRMNHLKVKTCQ